MLPRPLCAVALSLVPADGACGEGLVVGLLRALDLRFDGGVLADGVAVVGRDVAGIVAKRYGNGEMTEGTAVRFVGASSRPSALGYS